MKTRIAVIFTGGTIASRTEGDMIRVGEKAPFALLKPWDNHPEVTFDTFTPYTTLSELLCARHINALTAEAAKRLKEGYAGIIVTHGTDTLQYSAAALSICLGSDCPPVVLVSSQYPLEDPRTNGWANFKAAVALILEGRARGVFAAYRNEITGPVFIHRADEILSHGETAHQLYSADMDRVIRYDKTGFSGTLSCPEQYPGTPFVLPDACPVLAVQAYPGALYAYGELKAYKAVLLKPYHSSTLDTASAAFKAFCLCAGEAGLPLYLPCESRSAAYETAEEYEALGITVLPGETFVHAWIRLWKELT